VAPGPLIAVLLLVAAVVGLPAEAAAHAGLPGGGPHGGARHASAGLSALVLLGVPAAALAAGAVWLRRAVRA
jgi:hypothetical protein